MENRSVRVAYHTFRFFLQGQYTQLCHEREKRVRRRIEVEADVVLWLNCGYSVVNDHSS